MSAWSVAVGVAAAVFVSQPAKAQTQLAFQHPVSHQVGIGASLGWTLGKRPHYNFRRVHGTLHAHVDVALPPHRDRMRDMALRPITGVVLTYRQRDEADLELLARGGIGAYFTTQYDPHHFTAYRSTVGAGVTWRPSTGEIFAIYGWEARALVVQLENRFRAGDRPDTIDFGFELGLFPSLDGQR